MVQLKKGCLISKFFIYESVAPAKAKSHHFKNMIIGAQQAGMGIEPPSPYEIKNKYLEMEYKEMEAYVNQQREKWKTYGCTIMSDGWTGPTKLSIINFMVYSKGSTVFLKPSVIEVINNARKITNFIYNHGWLLAQMRLYCGGDIVRPGVTRMTNIVSLYEPLYMVLQLMDSEVVPTMPFVYELMHVMKENLTRQGAGDWIFKIIQDRWEKTLKHPLHAAAYFLNPRFQYRRGVGSDPELLQVVHDVFAKFDPTTESLGQFGNEMQKEDSMIAGIAARSTMVPAEVGEEEDNQLFQWVRPIHLDDEVGNPDPRIAAHAREFGVNVERVLSEEVHSESFSKDTNDSHQEIDSTSAGHSSRPSATGTSASGYDGLRGGTDDGGDNAGGDINEHQHSQYPVSQFTCENTFTHCTQDEDHGSRRAGPGIGAIGKPYRRRERMMEPYNEELLSGSFESMSIGTQFSDSSNEANVYPPHVMSYGQPSSSTDEEYGMSHYSPSRQMPYQVPYQMERGLGINTWVNFEYPIHVEAVGKTQEIYA
ncbi:hypothetical protein CK203_059778 [Vitis vinifera]|uniref:DUF659 domain-containing protein n=1 Tax=Vitis vinifera TaxID=29760 RepID=A0A438FSG6_VITVI|nr:hypothetical protein CK203_059778 [Vitis vinifera]